LTVEALTDTHRISESLQRTPEKCEEDKGPFNLVRS